MKAKDLMISDFVAVNGGITKRHGRVAFVSEQKFANVGIDETHSIEASEEDIEDIPLTPEILERNGFKEIPAGLWKWTDGDYKVVTIQDWRKYRDCKGWRVRATNSLYSDITVVIDSVREFQHALRLCGIGKEIKL